MSSNNLDEIVKCSIDISMPATNEASFGTILLVVTSPDGVGETKINDMIAISQAKDLKEYGFTDEHPAYVATSVAYSQNPPPGDIYVIVREKDSSENYESIKTTLDRALENNVWYGIHITSFDDVKDINDTKEWTEANAKLFAFEYSDIDKFPIDNTEYYRTFGMFSENKYAALAWMSKCFTYEPGSETWALKTLSAIAPSKLSTSAKKKLDNVNVSYYLRYAGKNVINAMGGKVLAGEWIDVIRFRDWLKNELQVRIFNLLSINRKLPFEDSGISAVEGQMRATLKDGQEVGGIAKTSYDEEGNEVPGYTVKVPMSANISDIQKASRILTDCKFTARLAGAIHVVNVSGNLIY